MKPTQEGQPVGGARDVLQKRAEIRHDIDRNIELVELLGVARALSSERDVGRLLDIILEKSRHVTGADAGSIYLVEENPDDPGENRLRFKIIQNDSTLVELREHTLEISDRSIVGSAVIRAVPINIPDLYFLPEDNPFGFKHDRSFDRRLGYESRSMLTVPMTNQRGDVIGAIQLINRKTDFSARLRSPEDFGRCVLPFDAWSEELVTSLASLAGVALENARMYEEERRIFEAFVHASVVAIESRDPTTMGHSVRVATLTCKLARAVDGLSEGPFGDTRFSPEQMKELEFASMLHDFGKIGVREHVLVKSEKLLEHEKNLITQRFEYIHKDVDFRILLKTNELYRFNGGGRPSPTDIEGLELERGRLHAELDGFLETVLRANRPSILEDESSGMLSSIAARTYRDASGRERPYLTPGELECLKIRKGSLTEEERLEIESHVSHTFNFLRRIPWGRGYRRVPEIARMHHEKIDGSGYPSAARGEQIPIQARIMAICDIFDALTASDRPYKRSMSPESALRILESDTRAGKYDPDLVGVFIESKAYDGVAEAVAKAMSDVGGPFGL